MSSLVPSVCHLSSMRAGDSELWLEGLTIDYSRSSWHVRHESHNEPNSQLTAMSKDLSLKLYCISFI